MWNGVIFRIAMLFNTYNMNSSYTVIVTAYMRYSYCKKISE